MSEKITITVAAGGDDADARAFGAVLRDVLDTLDAIAKQQVGGAIAVTWKIVGLTKQSPPSITLECRQNISVVNVFLNGLRDLQTMAIIPFPPPAMKSVRRLGRRMRSRQVDSIIVESPGLKSVAPTERIADNAEKALPKSITPYPPRLMADSTL